MFSQKRRYFSNQIRREISDLICHTGFAREISLRNMEKNKKKVLIFLTRVPYPPVDGTRFKIFNNVILGLKPAFDLEFCVVTDDCVKAEQVKYLEDNFGPVHLFTFPKWRFYGNALKMFFSRLPLQAGYYYFRDVQQWFLNHLGDYDAVYAHTLRVGRYLERLSESDRRKILVDFNDAISLNYREGKRFASPLWRMIYSVEEARIRRYEARLLTEFHYFNIASRRDREYLLENVARGGRRKDIIFENIPHGVDSKLLNYTWQGQGNSLVFMGNLKYPPNADAVRFFLARLWPALKAGIPSLRVTIIGNGDGLNFGAPKDATFTGFVDDPYKIIAASRIFIAPLRFGAGTPTKILEAMAVGIPVITTPLGASGVEGAENGRNLLVVGVNDVEGWIRAIKSILEDNRLAERIGVAGRQFVTDNYLDKSSQRAFVRLFGEIAGK